ncbi:cytochrome c3 family protein [Gammaproteobacteria bacterium]|nr:cytochrome c3 family protein [Gammaproteobacteria bacterium]
MTLMAALTRSRRKSQIYKGLLGACGWVALMMAWQSAGGEVDGFVGSDRCLGCHQQQGEAWQQSDHGWALKHADDGSVLADFDDQQVEHLGVEWRFYRQQNSYWVDTLGESGDTESFEILYTVGFEPLQQYLVELSGGRLQALDMAWDTENKRWFHLYPSEVLQPNNGLHWTGPYKNWNARCAECHQTNFKKGYQPLEDRYQSQWSELTVGCEACHGPGKAHVAQALESEQAGQSYDHQRSNLVSMATAKDELKVCAGCHSRRSALGADSPPVGSDYEDHYRLALLREPTYYADGQIRDEVYVYGSFLQSKMFDKGVSCSDCHNPHSAQLVVENPDAVCAQCHNPAGNSRFPSLKKTDYTASSHHHHQPASEAASCVSCHMPNTTYMQVDPRRDHSFRVPRPDLSEQLGSPNACTGCHEDQDSAWAANAIADWFVQGQHRQDHVGQIFHQAASHPNRTTADALKALAIDSQRAAWLRASALSYLGAMPDWVIDEDLARLLADPSPLVRQQALALHQSADDSMRAQAARALVDDPAKTVRIEAARLALDSDMRTWSQAERQSASKAIKEYQQSLIAVADFPEGQMQIGGLALHQRSMRQAASAFERASQMDPQLTDAWLVRTRLQSALGQAKRAIETLENAREFLPDDTNIALELAGLYGANGKNLEATILLREITKKPNPPDHARELLALNYAQLGDLQSAQNESLRLLATNPDYPLNPALRELLD